MNKRMKLKRNMPAIVTGKAESKVIGVFNLRYNNSRKREIGERERE